MKRKFSDEKVNAILNEGARTNVTTVCQKHGIHRRTFYKWLSRKNENPQFESVESPSRTKENRMKRELALLHQAKEKMPNEPLIKIVKYLIREKSLPVSRACAVAGFSRSTYYRKRWVRKDTMLSKEAAAECRRLVEQAAKKWDLPPVHITAHITSRRASAARKEVIREMITRMGLSRRVIAKIFDRDPRRVRKSVLGV